MTYKEARQRAFNGFEWDGVTEIVLCKGEAVCFKGTTNQNFPVTLGPGESLDVNFEFSSPDSHIKPAPTLRGRLRNLVVLCSGGPKPCDCEVCKK